MNLEWIIAFVEALRHSQAVPMPGGHGTTYERERQACLPYRDSPGLPARCLGVLGILADSTELTLEEQVFVLHDWRMRVIDWSNQHSPHCPIPVDERALYIVHAMETVVTDWAAEQPASRQAVADEAREARGKAEAIIRHAMVVFGRRPRMLPWQQVPAYRLMGETRWDKAFEVLNGPRPEEVLALLFLHLLHATLGIRQPAVDLPNLAPEGLEFYARVVDLLGHVRCRHRELALSIGAVISRTALVRGPNATLRLMRSVADLPRCFGTHAGDSIPDLTLCFSKAGYGEAAELLNSTEWLATTITNLIMDILRLRPIAGVPGFTAAHCRWLVDRAPRLPHLYLALRDGNLPRLAQRYLGMVHSDHWAGYQPAAKPCALCHVETA